MFENAPRHDEIDAGICQREISQICVMGFYSLRYVREVNELHAYEMLCSPQEFSQYRNSTPTTCIEEYGISIYHFADPGLENTVWVGDVGVVLVQASLSHCGHVRFLFP